MIRIQAPPRYIQGKNALDELGQLVKDFGDNFLILSGNTALKMKKDDIEKGFKEAGINCTFERFTGEITYAEIDRVADIIRKGNFNGIIGLGGGKVLDTAKTAAAKTNIPVIISPTIASSDAPCSAVAVIYDEKGNVCGFEFFKSNPDLVLVDSQMIANAPVHTLVAGIGDALATYFEARVGYEEHKKNVVGSYISQTGYGLAKLCYETLKRDALKAVQAVELNIVTQALENVIEANTYLSGIGFENGGVSCAHSIQDALTAIPECHEFLHGHRVAFGTVALLVLQDKSEEELEDVLKLCTDVGLPVTLKQLGLTEDVERKIKEVVNIAYVPEGESSVYNIPEGTTLDDIYAAILMADKIGQEYLDKIGK